MKDDLQTNFSLFNNKTDAILCARFFIWSLLISLSISGCRDRKSLIDEPLYDGPTISMDSVYTKLSDSAKIVMRLRAPKQNDFENDDREWPKSLYLEYLDDSGRVETTFQADYVYYTSKDNEYRGEGNVIVRNALSGDELNTELLFWLPAEKKFHTDRFVTIQSEDEIHTGEGMTADEDFSTYTILKPTGTINVNENETP